VPYVTTASITGSISHWLLHFHGGLAYVLIGALVFAEAALLIGFVLPGETAAVVGRTAGPWLLDKRPLRGSYAVQRTKGLLERRGGPAVLIGRFVTFARAVVPGLAGMSGLRYRTFLGYNALGGLLWGVGYTLLGYVVGRSFTRIVSDLSTASLVLIAVACIAFVAFMLYRRSQRRGAERLAAHPK